MYEKGYIDPEIITMDYASFVPKLAQNTVASFYGPLGGMLAAQNATMPASFPGFHVEATVPPKGTAQIHSYIDQEPRAIAAATITASCKNVDRVVALLDYMYSAEGTLLINMGIEGTHYTMQDGKPMILSTAQSRTASFPSWKNPRSTSFPAPPPSPLRMMPSVAQ